MLWAFGGLEANDGIFPAPLVADDNGNLYGWPDGLTRRFPWMVSHIRAGRPFIRTSC
jgi:hypothetical protein